MKIKLPLIVGVLLIENVCNAQSQWTLSQCINYALQNNIQVKQQNLNILVSKNHLTTQKLAIAPAFNSSLSHNFSFGRSVDYSTNTKISSDMQSTNVSVNAQVSLFSGLRQYNRIKQAQLDLLATVADAEKLKNNIALNITQAYLQILYNTELVETNARTLELTEAQRQRTQNLVNAGSLAKGSLLQIEAQRASDELNLVNAQNQLELSYLNLAQMLDLRSRDSFRIAKPEIQNLSLELPPQTAESIYHQAINLPQIQSAQLRVESAQRNIAIAKGGRFPTLSFGASYGSGARKTLDPTPAYPSQPYAEQIRDNASTSIGFSLNIPIFNGLQIEKNIANAKIGLENAQLALVDEKNRLFKDIQLAYTDAQAAQKKLRVNEKNSAALEESMRYTESKFNLGLVNALDYTTALNKLTEAKNSLLQAKYELIFKIKILQFYQGEELSL